MGGNDSKPTTPNEPIQFDFPKDDNSHCPEIQIKGNLTYSPKMQESIEVKQKEKNKQVKTKLKKQVRKRNKVTKQKQNVIRFKKTKERRWNPQLEYFFCQMLRQSRTNLEQSPSKIQKKEQLPTVTYCPLKKGDILPPQKKVEQKKPWDRPINHSISVKKLESSDQGYLSINERSKSSFKIEEIQTRLNNIKDGFEHTLSLPILNDYTEQFYDIYI